MKSRGGKLFYTTEALEEIMADHENDDFTVDSETDTSEASDSEDVDKQFRDNGNAMESVVGNVTSNAWPNRHIAATSTNVARPSSANTTRAVIHEVENRPTPQNVNPEGVDPGGYDEDDSDELHDTNSDGDSDNGQPDNDNDFENAYDDAWLKKVWGFFFGPRIFEPEATIQEIFSCLLPERAIRILTSETNRYAEQYFTGKAGQLTPNARVNRWKNVAMPEVESIPWCYFIHGQGTLANICNVLVKFSNS